MKKFLLIIIVIVSQLCLTDLVKAQFTEIDPGFVGVSDGDLAYGDWDNDGDLDVIISGRIRVGENSYDKVTKQYRNNGNGTFTNISTNIPNMEECALDFGDYDNDGDLDLIITGYYVLVDVTTRTTKIFTNNGAGVFTEVNTSLAGLNNGSVEWGDYDNDGDLDIILSGENSPTTVQTKLYKNNGSGTFVEVSAGFAGVCNGSTRWGDYDNDGDLDLLVTGSATPASITTGITKLYKNNGNDTFAEVNYGLAQFQHVNAVWGDYDSDGDLDIVVSGKDDAVSTRLYIYRNDISTSNTFTKVLDYLNGTTSGEVSLGDFDNDGDIDIAFTGQAGVGTNKTRVLRNDGGNSFTGIDLMGLGVNYGLSKSSLEFADYDNDGDLDVLVTGLPNVDGTGSSNFDRETYIYSSNAVSANTLPNTPAGLSTTVTDYEVDLNWNKSTDAETPQDGLNYNLIVGTTSGGSEIFAPESRTNGYRMLTSMGNANSNNSWRLEDLPVGGTYYWKVQAIDGGLRGSAFSSEGTFVIKPAPPVLASPADNAYKQSTSPTLSWNSSVSATTYGIQISTLNDFSTTIVNETEIAATSYSATGLNGGQKYYWRVNAVSAAGTSSWSEVWCFTVQLQPPVIVSPADGAINQPVKTTLVWQPANLADRYNLKVSENSDLSAPIFFNQVPGTSHTMTGLSGNRTYYWAVQSSDDADRNRSNYTATHSYTTKSVTQIAGGTVSGTWSSEDSPLEVNGNINIANGTTLIIEPGVEVYFTGNYYIDVKGSLIARGNENDSIKFSARNTSTGWNGIRLEQIPATNDSTIFDYCVIEYSKNTYGGLYCRLSSKIKISNSRFTACNGNSGSIALLDIDDITIFNNLFSYNSNSSRNIWGFRSAPNIINNTFENCGTAITLTDCRDTVLIYGNNFSDIQQNAIDAQYASAPYLIRKNTIMSSYTAVSLNAEGTVDSNIIIGNNKALYIGNYDYVQRIANNIICNNEDEGGDGVIYLEESKPLFENNTISQNIGTVVSISDYSGETLIPIFRNNIFWNNSGTEFNINTDGHNPSMVYSISQNAYPWAVNSIQQDPLFVAPTNTAGKDAANPNANWNLQSSSPAIDAGDPASQVPAGGEIRRDMGALEFVVSGSSNNNGMDNTLDGNFITGMGLCVAAESGSVDATVELFLNPPPHNPGNKPTVGKYWDISCTGNANIRLHYPLEASAGFTTPTIFHYNGSSWEALPTTAEGIDGTVKFVESSSPITSWSLFTVGDGNDPLPVELVSFAAEIVNRNVVLSWQTATEIDNYGFEIQKQESGVSNQNSVWEEIAFVEGHGNSNSPKSYNFTDNAATHGKVKYRLKQIDIDGSFAYSNVIEVDLGMPKEYSLSQNYPNPFNPATTIEFAIPADAEVNLTVYNLLGEVIVNLINQELEAGYHKAEFNASQLPSGIYFYRLTSKEFSKTVKMMLLK